MMRIVKAIIFLFLCAGSVFSQVYFETGKISLQVSNYGRIRIYNPKFSSVEQINRLSAVIGVNTNDVFAYNEDAATVDSAKIVRSPKHSDFEIYNSTDNSYLNLPPALLNKMNVYGWSNEAFSIIKLTVINKDAVLGNINAFIGYEILPKVDDLWGTETIKTLNEKEIISISRSPASSFTGVKILSSPLFSAKYFNWYNDYDLGQSSDSMFYAYLSSGVKQDLFTASNDGAVGVIGQNAVNIKPGDSAVVYLALAVGADEATMLNNMDKAEAKYLSLFANVPVEMTSFYVNIIGNKVLLDWSTATETNNNGFNVERKFENAEWINLGFVKGSGSTADVHKYSFIDDKINLPGSYFYRIAQVDFDGTISYSKEIKVNIAGEPLKFELLQNYPNPFNNSTRIHYQIPDNTTVTLKIFDALGRQIKSLVNERQDAGTYEFNFAADGLSSGLYFLVLQTDNNKSTIKMFLLK
ncbi:MAG: T9SS C-terminal target domain-containing protein [Ignavibacteriales bacterium]|nr:MAG: T9SS C-terminal target domain-containing protein [Ignavibacteriales bacterium]